MTCDTAVYDKQTATTLRTRRRSFRWSDETGSARTTSADTRPRSFKPFLARVAQGGCFARPVARRTRHANSAVCIEKGAIWTRLTAKHQVNIVAVLSARNARTPTALCSLTDWTLFARRQARARREKLASALVTRSTIWRCKAARAVNASTGACQRKGSWQTSCTGRFPTEFDGGPIRTAQARGLSANWLIPSRRTRNARHRFSICRNESCSTV